MTEPSLLCFLSRSFVGSCRPHFLGWLFSFAANSQQTPDASAATSPRRVGATFAFPSSFDCPATHAAVSSDTNQSSHHWTTGPLGQPLSQRTKSSAQRFIRRRHGSVDIAPSAELGSTTRVSAMRLTRRWTMSAAPRCLCFRRVAVVAAASLVASPLLVSARSARAHEWSGRGREDDHSLPTQAGRSGDHHPDHRLQRRDGRIQRDELHRLGCRRCVRAACEQRANSERTASEPEGARTRGQMTAVDGESKWTTDRPGWFVSLLDSGWLHRAR